ncbi:HlyD family type I secretion periplasmic adaptor subunit [Vibrio sp. SM6]|uniref:Membrane fusion protein (MFP) family protein n=1 Tax=Vibrio agarilyticus TaxID=2726741 RepID=A0A7X8YII4_9VIBR|nr:HlyD family type I secretion periplasmic adaptor subunit [Vibrio agarilyticus]NLS14422.1 HlyD family type I secretion periplasmic adaptor subunit [Vibrio agarilyticus]
MSQSKIEHHLKSALISHHDAIPKHDDQRIIMASAMTTMHKTLFVFFVIVLIAIIFAAQAKLDIVVSVRGELLLESDVEKVQHLEGGILDEMLVRQGDVVFKGQPIARLRSVDRNTQLNTVDTEIIQLELDKIRLQSLIHAHQPDYSRFIEGYPTLVAANQQAWQQESEKNQSNESLILHDIQHKQSLIQSITKRRSSAARQLDLIRQQLEIKQTLHQEEMASHVDVLNMQVQESNMIREIENMDEGLLNERFELSKLKKQHKDLITSRNSEYRATLMDTDNALKLKQIQKPQHSDQVDRLLVYAPIDGVVDKVHFNFHSAVIPPGQSIADIAPLNNQLHGEAKIPRKEMGFVEVGQRVKVKFDTYNFAKFGVVEGQITSISRSSYQEEEEEFYLAAIRIEQNFVENSGTQYKLSPYMEFTADVKTGSRRVIEYAARPVVTALNNAFDER